MALDVFVYGDAPLNAFLGNITDLDDAATEIKVALLADTYTPAQNTDENWGEVSTHEITGTGYAAGGALIANNTLTQSSGTTVFDGNDVSWASSTITARYGVIYDDTPVADADKKLLAYIDFGENKVTSDTTFEIRWNAGGIFEIAAIQDE